MKLTQLLLLIAASSLGACASMPVNNQGELQTLKTAMAFGKVIELNQLDPKVEKDLLVRLFEVPISGESCFIETQGVCRNSYYISVSTFDQVPEINVFKSGLIGEISEIRWIPETNLDQVQIEFSINKYTKLALQNNKTLVNSLSKVVLRLSPKELVEIER